MATTRVLLDTNIIIAHINDENLNTVDAKAAGDLVNLIFKLGFIPTVSHGTIRDFGRLEGTRRELWQTRLRHYERLSPAPVSSDVVEQFPAHPNKQNQTDIEILSAHATGSSKWLVTEDRRMIRRAKRAGLTNVYSLQEALIWFTQLVDPGLHDVPDAMSVDAYTVNIHGPLFETLKDDYPDFIDWWKHKVVPQRRTCIILGDVDHLAGIAVLKSETRESPWESDDAVLKVCTFKVEEGLAGSRRGEMLLRAVINHARHKGFKRVYLTTFPEKEQLIGWLEKFGFSYFKKLGEELVLAKDLVPQKNDEELPPLDFAVKYGPGVVGDGNVYVVPIQPKFHKLLFPDAEAQQSLLPNQPCGNAIRKAYLSHAPINRLVPGDILIFVRTGGDGTTRPTVLGVVEETLRSEDPAEIAAIVRGRTVFSYEEIKTMCEKSPVLAIRFRFDRLLKEGWSMDKFKAGGRFDRTPQSIAKLSEGGTAWVKQKLERSH